MVLNLNRRLLPHPVAWESPHQPSHMLHMHSVCATKVDLKWAESIRSERRVKFPWIEINKCLNVWCNRRWLDQSWTWGMVEDCASLTSYETRSMCETSTVLLWYTWVDLLTGYRKQSPSAFLNITFSIRTSAHTANTVKITHLKVCLFYERNPWFYNWVITSSE